MGMPSRFMRGGSTTGLAVLDSQVQLSFSDYKLYGLQARAYSALGRRLQHRAQAEFYFLQGQLGQAVEQLQFAQQASRRQFMKNLPLMRDFANCASCWPKRRLEKGWRLNIHLATACRQQNRFFKTER